MSLYTKSCLISTSGALVLLAVLLFGFSHHDWVVGAVLIGSYYALIGFAGAAIIARINEHFDDEREKTLSSRLKAIELKLKITVDDEESTPTCRCYKPSDSNHTSQGES